jgi:hypothetical protein
MKICHLCGFENQDTAQFCISCGGNLQINTQSQQQSNANQNNDNNVQPNSNPQFQSQPNPGKEAQQQNPNIAYPNNQHNVPYNNGPNAYQGGYYHPVNQKNMAVAVLLDLIGGILLYFLSGIGQLYLGLHKRGIVLCLLGFIPIILNMLFMQNLTLYMLILVLGIAYVIFCAYDAYLCTKAINEGRAVPLLFGVLDLE